jgi:pimeloyl-ACP methyl ester carboxylesterase
MLFLLGADDRMAPARKAVELARRLPEGRSIVLPRAGHLMMLEDPSGTLSALRQIV